MSLRVWLPLNGNLDNQGLSSIETTPSNMSVNNEGKIGKCYSFNGNSSLKVTGFNLPNNQAEYSVAFWAKCTSASPIGCVFSNRTTTSSSLRTIFLYGNKQFLFDEGNRWTVTVTATYDATQWTHYTFTKKGSSRYIYINGKLAASDNSASTPSSISTNIFFIGASQSSTSEATANYLDGKMNDYRLYDHCLSAKEIKELSKGLVLHYKLDNNGFGNPNLIKNSINAPSGFNDYTSKAKTSRLDSDGTTATTIYAISFPEDTDTYSKYSAYVSFSRDASAVQKDGKTYTLSFKAKASKPLASYDFIYEYLNKTVTVNVGTQWQQVTITDVANGSYTALYVCYGQANRNKINGGTLYISDLKLELGSKATSWIPHTEDTIYPLLCLDSTTEPDCSGYSNHGTKNDLTCNTATPRYETSMMFNGTSSYIAAGRGSFVTSAISIAFWAYASDWTTVTRLASCTEGGGWNLENKTDGINFALATTANTYTTNTYIPYAKLTSGWHHIVCTYDGYRKKCYVDSELVATTELYTSPTAIKYNGTNGLFIGAEAGTSATTPAGPYFNGSMVDFRIYATALSEEDIKELYNTVASIDKNGNMFSHEFKES